jgi:hypothetical protein
MFHSGGLGFYGLIGAIIAVIPFWRICGRLGYSPWLSLLIIIPLANIVLLYFLAFADWPLQRGTAPSGTATATT